MVYNLRQEVDMLKVKGVYDGTRVVLLDPIALQPNTAVEVLIPESGVDAEQLYWQRLRAAGLITTTRVPRRQPRQAPPPVQVSGEPVSQTIVDERR
jgi:hypothetical protein